LTTGIFDTAVFTDNVNDTSGHIILEIYIDLPGKQRQFATGFSDAGGKLPPGSVTLAAICRWGHCHCGQQNISADGNCCPIV
jgi:hypothetical protein